MFSPTGFSPSTTDHPKPLRLTHSFLTAAQTGRSEKMNPTTPRTQPLPGITRPRFSHPPLSLATTHGITICFLFLRVLRCFTSPRSPPLAIYSPAGDTTSLVPGFPIRTSSDPRSVDSSPRLIAASYVLHRLPVPRHPPCALKHLQTQNQLIQKEIAQQNTTPQPPPPKGRHSCCGSLMLATTIHKSNTTPHHQSEATTLPLEPQSKNNGPVVSKPNSVSGKSFRAGTRTPQQRIQLIDRQHACCAPDPAHYRQRVPTRLTPHQ